MAPALINKLKTKKSKEAISSKSVAPTKESAAPVESTKESSQKRKRKSEAAADVAPNASTSVQAVSASEPTRKKSKKANVQTSEPAPVPVSAAVDEKTAAKKGKKGKRDTKAEERNVQTESVSLKGKEKEKGTEVVEKPSVAREKKRKEKEVQSTEVEAIVEAEKKKKKKKKKKKDRTATTDTPETAQSEPAGANNAQQEKSTNPIEAAPSTANQPKPAKKTRKGSAAPLTGISHPILTSKPKDKKRRKSPSPEPEPSASDVDEPPAPEKDTEGADEDNHLYGFSTDEDDSSDEEMGEEWGGIDVGKLPTIAKDDAVVKKKLEKAKRHPTEDRGVIYLGRIPHGFFEAQMRQYFAQFGTVTRLRLSRNKKTGRSKHYAFIEFDSSSVAQIVADTMDNYLLMGHILTCKIIPKDEVRPELWIGANRKWRAVPRDRIARVQHNKPRTEEEQVRAEKRLLKRQAERKRKLEEAGINYDFSAVAYKKAKSVEA